MRLISTYQHFRIYMNYNVVTLNFKLKIIPKIEFINTLSYLNYVIY